MSNTTPPAPGRAEALANARYDNGWYYCWLIERRDVPQPEWLGDFDWVKNANDAIWYARKEDAERIAGNLTYDGRVVVCEHGFMLSRPAPAIVAEVGDERDKMRRAVEAAVAWLATPEGQAEMRKRAADVEKICEALRQTKIIPWEKLHAPFTI